MDHSLQKNLIEIAFILLIAALPFLVCKVRKFPVVETLGLQVPNFKTFAIWVAAFLCIFAVTESIYLGLKLGKGDTWEWEGLVTVVRALKIGLFGPIAEELIFRGLLFGVIARSRPGPVWAIIITGVFFAASHARYDWLDILFILIDGLYFGLVRYKTNSVIITIFLHIFINAVAIAEYLFINARL